MKIRAWILAFATMQSAYAADLTQTYHLALDHDAAIKAEQASYLAKKQPFWQALAKFFPTVSARATTSGIHSDTLTPAPGSIGLFNRQPFHYNTKQYSLELNQPLFRIENWAALEQSRHVEKQGFAILLAANQDLIIRVSEQYFSVLAAEEDLLLAQAQKKAFARQLEQAKQRFEVGLIAITDVHEAQARNDNAEALVTAAENNVRDQYEILREIIGQPSEPLAKLVVDDKTLLKCPVPDDSELWVNDALKHNLNILAAQEGTLVAKGNIGIRMSGHYPSVDLSASTQKNKSPSTADQLAGQKQVGLSVSIPLFSGGLTTAQVRESASLYEEALQRLEQQRRAVFSETRQRFRGVNTQIKQVKSFAQAVVSNDSALQAIQAAYEVGTRTVVDILDAQSELLLAKRNYAKARFDYILEGLKLKRAAGTLKAEDLYQINEFLEHRASELN